MFVVSVTSLDFWLDYVMVCIFLVVSWGVYDLVSVVIGLSCAEDPANLLFPEQLHTIPQLKWKLNSSPCGSLETS